MKTIEFGNGRCIPYLEAYDQPEYVDNENRRVMSIEFEKDAIPFDELYAISQEPGNLEELVMTNDEMCMPVLDEEGNEVHEDGQPVVENLIVNRYNHYEMLMRLSIEPVSVGEDDTDATVYEDRMILKIAKLTPRELLHRRTERDLAELRQQLVDAGVLDS